MDIRKAIQCYKDDSENFGDNTEIISEMMRNLSESLGSIQESKESYVSFLKEYKNKLEGEQKLIFEDFITYCKNL